MPTILLVDDEDYIRDIFATALREFDVVEASRAADAIELARRQAPDLLITDIRMPDMDGLELVEMVKKLYPNLPTLVISGSLEMPEAITAGFEIHAQARPASGTR